MVLIVIVVTILVDNDGCDGDGGGEGDGGSAVVGSYGGDGCDGDEVMIVMPLLLLISINEVCEETFLLPMESYMVFSLLTVPEYPF